MHSSSSFFNLDGIKNGRPFAATPHRFDLMAWNYLIRLTLIVDPNNKYMQYRHLNQLVIVIHIEECSS